VESDRRLLGILTEAFGAHSTVFVRRHLEALAEFNPFVACFKRVEPHGFEYEPVHELCSSAFRFRLGNAALRLLPRRLRYTDAVEAEPLLKDLLARYRPKALHVHFGWMAARVAGVLASARLPYTVVIHGSDINQAARHPRSAYARRLRRAFRHAERCLFVSEHVRRKGLALGCPEDRAEVFYLGVPVGPRKADPGAEGPVKITCVARLEPVKGHAWLLRAFAQLVRRRGETGLSLIGDGTLRESLTRMAADLGIAERVIFRGGLDNSDVMEEMLTSHVYVQPSTKVAGGREEGLGLAIQEAMSVGLPVVASRVGGIPESVVHGETGLLVEDDDVEGLANALAELVEDPRKRDRFGSAGRERVHRYFDLAERNAALVEIIRDMVDK